MFIIGFLYIFFMSQSCLIESVIVGYNSEVPSTIYSWLNLLSSSNISLHRCSLLASLLNRVSLLACVIVPVLACWMELASAHTREHELALNLYRRWVKILARKVWQMSRSAKRLLWYIPPRSNVTNVCIL